MGRATAARVCPAIQGGPRRGGRNAAALACARCRSRTAAAVDSDRVRARRRSLFRRRARTGAVGGTRAGRGAGSRRDFGTRAAIGVSVARGPRGHGNRICDGDVQERAHRASDPAARGLRRQHLGLRRGARGARTRRPHRGAGAWDRGAAQGRARARTPLGEEAHGATGRHLHQGEGAAQAAAAPVAARRLRFLARPLFPAHRRDRLCGSAP